MEEYLRRCTLNPTNVIIDMRILLTFLLAFSLAACGGSDTNSAADESATSSSAATTEQSGDVDRTINIEASGSNNMRFAQTEFEVAPGETVRIVFENTDTSPSMEHNVVLLNSNDDEDVARVGEAGMSAGSRNDYVPDDPAVLAYTAIAPPGETVEVTFTVPEETGEYRYICTFPGHWATMQGTMRVTDSPA